MTETLTIPSPMQLRAELEQSVLNDLLGPAGGPTEVVTDTRVSERYILGRLAPKGQSIQPDETDELAESGTDTEDGKPASRRPKAATMLPSSLGLTFTLDSAATAIQITARWGSYQRVSRDDPAKPEKSERVWQRVPVEGVSPALALKAGKLAPWSPSAEYPEVEVQGLVRKRDHEWVVTLFLVNGQQEPKQNKDTAWLFQPELSVAAPDGAPIFCKRQQLRASARLDDEDLAIRMLYRRQVEFAVGHGVAVHAELAEGRWDAAVRLSTQVAPVHEVERVTPPTAEEIPALAGLVLDMQVLAVTADGGFAAALAPVATAYEQWIGEQQARIEAEADLQSFAIPARQAMDECKSALQRIRAGIALLDSDPRAATSFRFANQAMALQRVHSIYVRALRQAKQQSLADIDIPGNRTWYPFQLAFILQNLPSLTDPLHPERSHPTQAIVDLLWFPTGGGKTEAYLGLTAYTIGLRRLLGRAGEAPRHGAGVGVLMRYTLRLLTLQQFQRATALICACETIRREAIAQGDARWGAEPFRIGLWVGQRSTPNWTKDSAEIIREQRDPNMRAPMLGRGTPYQLTNCPWCGSPIKRGRDVIVETVPQGRGRTFTFCGDEKGECPFSRKQSPDEGLPVVVVDEEIYRRLPALLIATVDKFAQMPWKGETQMLFGQVNGYCARHGYRSPEIEDADSHNALREFPRATTVPCEPLRPPDLIIQDELHLINGPLGTLVGLYETAVDQLASWDLNGKRVRPKVIASSATVRKAGQQVAALYLRRAQIFPPPGIDSGDNFFARRRTPSEENPGRRYLGVCSPGPRMRSLLIRVYVAYLSAAQSLYDKYGRAADPWMTLVGYFNSMRELGGMRRATEDSVRTWLPKMEERGLARRYLGGNVEELTSRKSATDIPQILDRLETVFDPAAETERKAKRKARETVDSSQYPIDVLLATNMISVGVDVPRLGLMVVTSQPKATAEYIQATSRIGRQYPGLVCIVYNWTRPRDLSHYERFEHYHATFYQHVEALSVTPFSPRALDRGLTALLASYIRLQGTTFNANLGAELLTQGHPTIVTATDDISRRAGSVAGPQAAELVRSMLGTRIDEWLARIAARTGGAHLGYEARDEQTIALLAKPGMAGSQLFTCLNSLRDVEPAVNLILRDHGMDAPAAPWPPATERLASEDTTPADTAAEVNPAAGETA